MRYLTSLMRCLALLCLPVTLLCQRPTDFENFDPSSVRVSVDSVERKPLTYTYFYLDDPTTLYRDLDTTLRTLHQVESYYKEDLPYGIMGTEFSSNYQPIFQLDHDIGIDPGNVNYGHLSRSRDKIVQVNRTLFDITYASHNNVNGSNLDVKFYKQFKDKILLNFEFKQDEDDIWLSSESVKNDLLNLRLFKENKTGTKRYHLIFDKRKVEDNPTWQSTTDNSIQSSDLVTSLNTIEFGHHMFLDTLVTDSTATLYTTLNFSTWDRTFTDGTVTSVESSLYGFINQNASSLNVQNKFSSISLYNKYSLPLANKQLDLGLRLSYVKHIQESIQRNYVDGILEVEYQDLDLEKKFTFNIHGAFNFLSQGGEFSMKPYATIKMSPTKKLKIGVQLESYRPPLFYDHFVANDTLIRTSTFDKIRNVGVELTHQDSRLPNFTLRANRYDNFIYYNSRGYTQHPDPVNVFSVSASHNLSFWVFNTSHQLMYQYIDDPILERPGLAYRGNIEAPLYLFGRKMEVVLGTSVDVIPSFDTPGFLPITGDFFPNLSSEESNHIFIVNPYANFKVDKLYVFLRGTNVTSRLFSTQQYFVHQFPISDFSFSFGVRWLLLD